MADPAELSFESEGERCAAWHLPAAGDALSGPRGRPCAVMAHGIGGTRDSGLLPFAEAYAAAGIDALLFDYRCFGDSGGEPRQLASPRRHRRDYRAAIAFARTLSGVDPDRIVLWGTSWSGGHVVYAAAEDRRIAAVVSQTPDLDGLRTLGQIRAYAGLGALVRTGARGFADELARLGRRSPRMLPIVGPPGEVAAIASEGSEQGYLAIAGPTWRNEICARAVLEEAGNRAIGKIRSLPCPVLIQVASRDTVAPPAQARAAARRAGPGAELITYDLAHFEIYVGAGRERALRDQLAFLLRHLERPGRALAVAA